MNKQSVCLSKIKKLLPLGLIKGQASVNVLATVLRNFGSLGYILSKDLFETLKLSTDESIKEWSKEAFDEIKNLVGKRKYKPMYPNFPKEVMDMDDSILYLNAICHYLGFVIADMAGLPDFRVMPNIQEEKRKRINPDEFNTLKEIGLANNDDFNQVFTNLVTSNGSLSEDDYKIVKYFLELEFLGERLHYPDNIPQKEILSFLVANSSRKNELSYYIKTATDVLRVATALSGGDVSLADNTNYKLSRSNRKFLLNCLNNIPNALEDMARHPSKWVRLGEVIHPGEFKDKFDHAFSCFKNIRMGCAKTFNSKLETAGSVEALVELLSKRPGDFARRLDAVLLKSKNAKNVVDEFISVADKVSTPVLLQVWKHFETRNSKDKRVVFPKGAVSKVQLIEPNAELDQDLCNYIHTEIRKVLVKRFSVLPSLGKVSIDEKLKTILVPFSKRSAKKTISNVSRGSKFDFDTQNKSLIRFFCFWKQPENTRVDIDLSAVIFDENWKVVNEVTFYNLKNSTSRHSGDITSAPQGAAEYIDLELKAEGRYVAMSIYSYNGVPFEDMPECFAGWMLRNKMQEGEIFDPRTVQEKVDITGKETGNMPLIIDLKENKVIWTDISSKGRTAHDLKPFLQKAGDAIINLKKPTLYDLFSMHKDARENLGEKSETVFGLYAGDVICTDTDVIMSNYLN